MKNQARINTARKITKDGDDTYVGVASLGADQASAVWQCRKISKDGDTTVITWADGNDKLDNVATDLTSLSYS